MSDANAPAGHPLARAVAPIAVLTLVWGCNWPILKIGVTELAPLTFRALTLPFAAIGLLAAAVTWAFGTVLVRKWKPPQPQSALVGWMTIIGWVPIALAAPFFDSQPLVDELSTLGGRGWFAILYNIFLAGTVAHWAWFHL